MQHLVYTISLFYKLGESLIEWKLLRTVENKNNENNKVGKHSAYYTTEREHIYFK